MRKIRATTFVMLPIGTDIELYTPTRPTIGQEVEIKSIETKKIVHTAKVKHFEDAKWKTQRKHYRVLAKIVK
jgi:hypothetical protein